MKELPPPIDWPPNKPEKKEVDTRMVQCVLSGYFECPAKVPAACICSQMDKTQYLEALDRKYGKIDG